MKAAALLSMRSEAIDVPRNWTFETQDIAAKFDRHVREQLPWYDLASSAVGVIARHYLEPGGLVYDLGCSTGNIARTLEPILLDRRARLVGVDSSEAMRGAYRGPGEFLCADIAQMDFEPFDVAVLFLALMFVPLSRRRELIEKLRERMKVGGCVIVFDKMLPCSGYLSTVLWHLTLAGKVAAGVSAEEIIAKELSLAGVQKPAAPELLGPSAAEWFRYGDFAGYVIESARYA